MKKILIYCSLIASSVMFSQVGINTNNPEATLDLRGKNHLGAVTAKDGLLVPRVNSLVANGTVNGQLVYLIADTSSPTYAQGFYYWDGSSWVNLSSGTGVFLSDTTPDVWVDNSGGTAVLSTKPVVIGTATSANASSILDMSSVANKGMLTPQVALTSNTDVVTIPSPKTGLLVYNTGTNAGLSTKGYLYWNGTEWRSIDNSTLISPSVASVNCLGAILTPKAYTAGTPFNGLLTIPYAGGNGGSYSNGTPQTVNGLTFTLQGGQLQAGTGNLVFNVSGTPTVSSPTETSISINSSSVPFLTASQSCTITVGNSSQATITESAVMGPLVKMDDPRTGYGIMATTPDGKYSIRVWDIYNGIPGNVSVQIRPNTALSSLTWNHDAKYYNNSGSGAILVYAKNVATFPTDALGKWCGTTNSGMNDFTLQGSLVTDFVNPWGDFGIADGSNIEHRRYTWTNTDPNDRTMYQAEIMLGLFNNTSNMNTTTCTNGVCGFTKAYIKITQTSGN